MGAAYGIYYITRKSPDGRSILDELLEHPKDFLNKAKSYAMADVVHILKEKL